MKGKIVIGLLAAYLIGSTEFHQVLRLPLLFRHYTEHRAQVEDMTFWEFLVMHYKTDVAHDDKDMSLPFKDCHHPLTAQTLAIPAQKIALTLRTPVSDEPQQSFNRCHFHSSFLDEIFQPPRV